MRVGMALFEERVQALLLRIGNATLVEEGDELVFGDILHVLSVGYVGEGSPTNRSLHYEVIDGSKLFLGRTRASRQV